MRGPRLGRRSAIGAVAAITALGALLRFATLDVQSLSGDEGVTSALLRMSLGDMLSTIPDSESTPPLYYVLAWMWTRAAGHGELGMRSLSALAGTMAIPALFAAGRALVSERAGVVAAALAAVSPLLVWYSQEARSYALLMLLATLSLWTFARVLDSPTRRGMAAWAVVCAIALATHYYAGFLVLGEAAWLVWRTRARRDVLLACAAIGAVALGLLPLALDQRSSGNFTSFIEATELSARVKEVPKKFLLGEQGTPGDYGQPAEALKFPAALLSAAAAALLFARARGRERVGGLAATAVGIVAAGVPLAMALAGFDYFAAYLLIGAWVPLAVAVSAGAAAAGRAGLVLAGLLGVSMLAVTISVPAGETLQRPNYRAAAGALGDNVAPRAILTTPDNSIAPLNHYLRDLEAIPAAGAPVAEVAVLGMRSEDGSWWRRANGTPRTPPGFKRLRVEEHEDFTLVRYRALDSTGLASPAELLAARLGETDANIALQR